MFGQCGYFRNYARGSEEELRYEKLPSSATAVLPARDCDCTGLRSLGRRA